jgi:hypothetical protein
MVIPSQGRGGKRANSETGMWAIDRFLLPFAKSRATHRVQEPRVDARTVTARGPRYVAVFHLPFKSVQLLRTEIQRNHRTTTHRNGTDSKQRNALAGSARPATVLTAIGPFLSVRADR